MFLFLFYYARRPYVCCTIQTGPLMLYHSDRYINATPFRPDLFRRWGGSSEPPEPPQPTGLQCHPKTKATNERLCFLETANPDSQKKSYDIS